MADYQLATEDPDGPVIRTRDQANIPNVPGNADWERYRVWRSLGREPDPFGPPAPPPDAPEPYRAR